MRRLIKVLAVVVLLFLLLGVGAVFYLKAQFPPERIRALVTEKASEALGRSVSVGDAGISLWPLGVSLKDVRIANNPDPGFTEDPLLSLPEAQVVLDLGKLLTFRVSVAKIELIGLSLNYEMLPDGRTSLDGIGGTAEKDTTSAPLDLSNIELPGTFGLEKFEIRNASVVFSDRKSGRKITVGDIDERVDLDLDRTLENIRTTGELTISEVSVQDAATGIRKGGVHLSLTHDLKVNLRKQELVINGVQAGFQDIRIDIQGSVNHFLDSVMALDLSVKSNTIQMASLIREIPAGINPEISKVSAEGSAEFQVAVKGELKEGTLPSLDGALHLRKIGFSHSDVPAKLSSLDGDILFTAQHVLVRPFGFQLAGQPVSVDMEVDGLPESPVLKALKVDSRLDLGALFALASKLIPTEAGQELAGIVETHLQASGPLDPNHPEALQVQGRTTLQGVVARTPQIPDAVTANGSVVFANTRIAADIASRIGPSDAAVKAEVTDFLAFVFPELAPGRKLKASVTVTSSNLELDRLMPPSNPEETKPEEAGALLPEIPDVDADVQVRLAHTVFRHLTLSDFLMTVALRSKVADVAVNGKLYDGSISAKVKADLADRANGKVALALMLSKVEANDMISNGNDNIPGDSPMAVRLRSLDNTLYGKLDANIDVRTHGIPSTFVQALEGTIILKGYDGRLAGSKIGSSIASTLTGWEVMGKKPLKDVIHVDFNDIKFRQMNASLEAKDGRLLVKEFQLAQTAMGGLGLDGSVGFDGTLALGAITTLSPELSKKLDGLQKSLFGGAASLVGGVAGSVPGAGSVANSLANTSVYPKDKQGNAQFFLSVGGTFSDPKPSIDAKRMASATAATNSQSGASNVVSDVKAQVGAKLDEVKDKAKAELDKKKAELEAAAEQKKQEALKKADAEKQKLKAKADSKKKEVKAKAKDEAGKALKNLGF